METYGLSITVTSATNLIAFLCGSVTRIPSVKAFCYYAGVSIIVDYLLQISVFLSLLVLNERRAGAGYADVLCCVKVSASLVAGQGSAAMSHGQPAVVAVWCGGRPVSATRGQPLSREAASGGN